MLINERTHNNRQRNYFSKNFYSKAHILVLKSNSRNTNLCRGSVHASTASVNSSCAQPPPPPPRATAGHLPSFSVLGVGHLEILRCPGTGHLPTPGLFPNFPHARGFLSEYYYTEDITEKKSRFAHLSRTGGCKGMLSILCMHFFIAYQARITYRNSGAIDVNQRFLVSEANFC